MADEAVVPYKGIMIAHIQHGQTPEEDELNKKVTELSELETELSQRELDLATFKVELRVFEAKYLRTVGVRYAELDATEAEIAKLQARLKPANNKTQEFAEQAQKRAIESEQATAGIEQQPHYDKFSPTDTLKTLYRDIAKQIHPDLATDEGERNSRQRLMVEANRAYEEGNETRLKEILREWESNPDSVKGEGVGVELVRIIRKIAQAGERLQVITIEIAELETSDLFQLKTKVETAEREGTDLLSEMASKLDSQISLAKQNLDKLRAKRSQWE